MALSRRRCHSCSSSCMPRLLEGLCHCWKTLRVELRRSRSRYATLALCLRLWFLFLSYSFIATLASFCPNVAIPENCQGTAHCPASYLVMSLGFGFSSLSGQVKFNRHVLLVLSVFFFLSLRSLFTGARLKANRSIIWWGVSFYFLSSFSEATFQSNTYGEHLSGISFNTNTCSLPVSFQRCFEKREINKGNKQFQL